MLNAPGRKFLPIRRSSGLLLLGLAFSGCGDGPVDVTAGSGVTLTVSLASRGTGTDADGITVWLRGPGSNTGAHAELGGTLEFAGLAPGRYSLQINGLANHCYDYGQSSRSVDVDRSDVSVTVPLRCLGEYVFDQPSELGSALFYVDDHGIRQEVISCNCVFGAVRPDGAEVIVMLLQGDTTRIALVGLDGRLRHPDFRAVSARWSPDGSTLALTSLAHFTQLFDVETLSPLWGEPKSGEVADWSPGGDQVLMVSYQTIAPLTALFKVVIHALKSEQDSIVAEVLDAPEDGFAGALRPLRGVNHARWSADGRWIAFGKLFPQELYLLEVPTGRITQLMADHVGWTPAAWSWSPTESKLAVGGWTHEGDPFVRDAHLFDPVTGAITWIRSLPEEAFGTDWSHDGTTILMGSQSQRLYAVDVASGGHQGLPYGGFNPRWLGRQTPGRLTP